MQGDEVKDMMVSRPKHRHQDQESNGVALLHSNDAINCSIQSYALERGSTTVMFSWTEYKVCLA